MATTIMAGVYLVPNTDEQIVPEIYIDHTLIQFLDEDGNFILQITYEELRGVMAIIAA